MPCASPRRSARQAPARAAPACARASRGGCLRYERIGRPSIRILSPSPDRQGGGAAGSAISRWISLAFEPRLSLPAAWGIDPALIGRAASPLMAQDLVLLDKRRSSAPRDSVENQSLVRVSRSLHTFWRK